MRIITASIATTVTAAGLAVAGCGHSSHPGSAASARARVSAAATSSTAQLTQADAKKLAGKCLPGSPTDLIFGAGGKTGKQTRSAFGACVNVPQSQYGPLGDCIWGAYRVARPHLPAAGTPARHQAYINLAFPCIQKAQAK